MSILVHNKSDRMHRYPLPNKEYIAWSPDQTREVPERIAYEICGVHPEKMEIVLRVVTQVPEEIEEEEVNPEEPEEEPEEDVDESVQHRRRRR